MSIYQDLSGKNFTLMNKIVKSLVNSRNHTVLYNSMSLMYQFRTGSALNLNLSKHGNETEFTQLDSQGIFNKVFYQKLLIP
jgi:hypothetical protein